MQVHQSSLEANSVQVSASVAVGKVERLMYIADEMHEEAKGDATER